jgi:tetratricopeptide (TPR) repeat protein
MASSVLGRAAVRGLLLALVVLLPASRLGADDVPAAVKKQVDEARALYVKGDAKSLSSAFTLLSQAKGKSLESVDFWELFVRVWRASKKPEPDLWDKIIAVREQQVPQAPTFDLVRARVETDPAKRREHLEKAIAKVPEAVEPRLLLARELLLAKEEVKAEEAIDALLEKHPDLEQAIVLKAELMVAGGLSRSAAKLLKEKIAANPQPGLHYALALALDRLAAEDDDKTLRAEALDAAQKAVAARPDPTYVGFLADLLDRADRMAEAVGLLKTHVATTKDPGLSRRLGAFAFRAGEYDAAAAQLAAAAATELGAAKALALCHARRGRAKEAKAAIEQVLALDKEAWRFAADAAWDLEDPVLVRKYVQGRSAEDAQGYLAGADALEGKAAAVQASIGAQAATGSRGGEDALLLLVRARLRERLGAKNAAYRKLCLDAAVKALAAPVPSAKPDDKPLVLSAKSRGFMQRAVTYHRSVCGDTWTAGDVGMMLSFGDGEPSISATVECRAECRAEPSRTAQFLMGKGPQIQMTDDSEGWTAAVAAFKEGSAALVAGEAAKAAEQFGKAFEKEPAWQRAKLLKAVATAFLPGADLATASKEVTEAANQNPDDWGGRSTAILLAYLAGTDPTAAMAELTKHIDARSHPPIDDL